ncbi:hypothetical protein JCM12296A_35020 [Desulfosarcina cetonica]
MTSDLSLNRHFSELLKHKCVSLLATIHFCAFRIAYPSSGADGSRASRIKAILATDGPVQKKKTP